MQKLWKFLLEFLTPIAYIVIYCLITWLIFTIVSQLDIDNEIKMVLILLWLEFTIVLHMFLYSALQKAGYIHTKVKNLYQIDIIDKDWRKETMYFDKYEYLEDDTIDQPYIKMLLDWIGQIIPKTSTILITEND